MEHIFFFCQGQNLSSWPALRFHLFVLLRNQSCSGRQSGNTPFLKCTMDLSKFQESYLGISNLCSSMFTDRIRRKCWLRKKKAIDQTRSFIFFDFAQVVVLVVKNRIYLYFFYTRLRKSNPVRGDRF